jgi:DNA polymerase-3 subunit epsilon
VFEAQATRLFLGESGVIGTQTGWNGGLVGAELLADVYINLTRGQEALLIDAGSDEGKAGSEEAVDLSAFVLPVIQANTQEHAAHEDQLAQLDKASDGKTIWRLVVPV